VANHLAGAGIVRRDGVRAEFMLEIMGDLVRTLVLIAMVGIVLDMLVPEDDYRRYLRMVIGLLILLMVIKAISGFLGRDFSDVFASAKWNVADNEVEAVAEQGQLLLEENRRIAVRECQKMLCDYLREQVADWEGWELADLEIVFDQNAAKERWPHRQPQNIFEQFENISLVKVFLTVPGADDGRVEDVNGGIRIEAIPPVIIGGGPEEDVVSAEPADDDAAVVTLQPLQKRIADLLQISPAKVEIVTTDRNDG